MTDGPECRASKRECMQATCPRFTKVKSVIQVGETAEKVVELKEKRFMCQSTKKIQCNRQKKRNKNITEQTTIYIME